MEDIRGWFAKFVCRILGHKKPYVEKFTALICGRCSLVIEDRTPLKLGATIVELKKKAYRIKRGL